MKTSPWSKKSSRRCDAMVATDRKDAALTTCLVIGTGSNPAASRRAAFRTSCSGAEGECRGRKGRRAGPTHRPRRCGRRRNKRRRASRQVSAYSGDSLVGRYSGASE
jgi:hypothetical protein